MVMVSCHTSAFSFIHIVKQSSIAELITEIFPLSLHESRNVRINDKSLRDKWFLNDIFQAYLVSSCHFSLCFICSWLYIDRHQGPPGHREWCWCGCTDWLNPCLKATSFDRTICKWQKEEMKSSTACIVNYSSFWSFFFYKVFKMKHTWLTVSITWQFVTYSRCWISFMTNALNFLKTSFQMGYKVKICHKSVTIPTRTVRKSDYTPALVLSKRMASVFDEKCREKEKEVLNMRKPVLNPTIQQVTVNLYNKFLSHDTHCLCYSVIWALYHIYSTKKYWKKEGKNIWKNI